jgi:hypothetical protein
MAKASGLFVILAGTASLCGAYLLHPNTATDRLVSPKLTDISSKQTDIVRDFDIGVQIPDSGGDPALAMAPKAMAPKGWRAYVDPAEHEAAVVVTITKRSNDQKVTTEIAPPPRSDDRTSLAGELQRELRRVGCYDGAISDSWTRATRTAMKTFTNRVNATLPIDKPDQILLALVQGYREKVCDVTCPAGEGLAKDGRCLPNAVLARVTKKVVRHNAPVQTAEQPGGHVTLVWSLPTPPQPELRKPAGDPTLLARKPTSTAYVPNVAGNAAAKRGRTRNRAVAIRRGEARHRSDFGSTIFRNIFRNADALGVH